MKEPDILTEEEAQRMIEAAQSIRDKAFIAVLYEGGFRIGEILPARLGDIQFDELGAKLKVQGKTGGRVVRLITSEPLLSKWVEANPFRDSPKAPIWVPMATNYRAPVPMSYQQVMKMLKETARRAGVKKRIYPHLFRHSAATRDAKYLTESELKVKYGWVGDSRMAATYVHLASADLDNKLAAIYAGRPVETIKPKFVPIICPRCGEQNTPGQRYCSRCGTPLRPEELAKSTVKLEEIRRELGELRDALKKALGL
ncbi:MAG: site-specific integrase [Conexivisphaerales archaeon]